MLPSPAVVTAPHRPLAEERRLQPGDAGSEHPVDVVYVGGRGRSGSTLLDRMLSAVPGFAGVGEVRFIWLWGVKANLACGCGAAFLECPFWARVGDEAYGGWHKIDPGEMISLQRSVARIRYLPFLLVPGLSRSFDARLARHAEVVVPLYRAIRSVSGASVVVDSSKDALYAYVLARVPGLRMRVVHLVRDSRAVVYSWTKAFKRPDVGARVMPMPRDSVAGATVRWALFNVLFDLIPTTGVRRVLVRYESLVEQPSRELGEAVRLVGVRPGEGELSFLEDGAARLGVHHTIAGNPRRLERGKVPLRVDDEWKEKLPRRVRWLVSVATSPLLVRYGYFRRRR